jgi:hypothetical protein
MVKKHYKLIVRNNICIPRPYADNLKYLDSFYQSPAFLWDGSFASLDVIINDYQVNFSHFLDWSANVVPV